MTLARAALALFVTSGCGTVTAPPVDAGSDARGDSLHAELAWRLRCEATGGVCASEDRVLAVYQDDVEYALQCDVEETETTRMVTLGAVAGSRVAFVMDHTLFPRAGGRPIEDGSVVVAEEGQPFLGACGGDPPSPSQPCRASVTFTRDALGSLITGEIFCVGLTPFGSTSPTRELTGPGDDVAAANTSATFSFRNCRGYVPD